MPLELTSPNLRLGQEIPPRFTCEGKNLSPALEWRGEPPGTKSFALILEDPDAPDPEAPKVTWSHWLLYDLPPDAHRLAEGVSCAQLPGGTRAGRNDFGRVDYGGPCPPIGRHRYIHRLFALDTVLPDLRQPDRKELLCALEGHVLEEAQLVGTYQKHH